MADLIGQTRFLRLVDESVWGTVPGGPTWYQVPVTDYGVRFKPKASEAQARVGQFQPRYFKNRSGHPSGNLVCPLYGWNPGAGTSLAQRMLEWGFADHETQDVRSKTAQWIYVAHEDDKTHNGLRCNQATLAGAEAGIGLTLDLIGKTADNAAASGVSPSNDREKLVEFEFEDAVLEIDSVETPMESFQWACQRGLIPKYMNGRAPTSLPKVQHMETFSFVPKKGDATYDDLRDALEMSEHEIVLTLKGLHNGTGTVDTDFTIVTITLARCSLMDSDESGGNAIVMNPLSFKVLKPDSSSNCSAMVWTEE